MITKNGPKVIEYNCRFGDPETQVVLPLLESSLLTIMLATANGTLAETEAKFSEKSAACVILASRGYPESYDKAVPEELVYSGKLKLTDSVEDSPLDAGKLVLSPTRTYAPVVKKLLDALRPQIHGMVHCSGGAQTKVLHFVGDNCRVIKDNLFPVPPLFKTIKEQSDTDWSEMYKVFNMGHRLEVYLSPEHAEEVIAISKSFNIDAQIVGRVEESDKKELIIKSEFGEFKY